MADTSNLSLLSNVIAITYGPLELGVDHEYACTYCKKYCSATKNYKYGDDAKL
jgi:hypothetical protein